MLTDQELFWLVGLLEGEGSFRYAEYSQRVQLNMTDEDIVIRAANLVEKLTGKAPGIVPYDRAPNKIQFRFIVYGESARIVMRAIVKHMGFRRRKQIYQSLNKFTAEKGLRLDVGDLVSRLQKRMA